MAAIDLFPNLSGDAADRLVANDFDPNVLRPWIGSDGKSYYTRMVVNRKNGKREPRVFVSNAPATLTRDTWIAFDNAVIRAMRERLQAFADLRAAGLEYNIPNGMSQTILQYQTMTSRATATISMDPIRRGEGDRPEVETANLPLPVIHSDFDFSARQIEVARRGGMPVDTAMVEEATRSVAEVVEELTAGTADTFTFGGGTIYGYINHPDRATKTDMTIPTGSNGPDVVADFLTLRQALIDNLHRGPYRVYVNSQWAEFLDSDFSTVKGEGTLRDRLLRIEGIRDIQTLDYLPATGGHVVMVEMTSETVRAVVGMEIQTVQWDSMGGLMKHFKVMCILIPQIRPDTNGETGIGHGSNSSWT